MKVLLTDGDERATLAATRALGKQGVDVVVGAASDRSLAATSRYCTDSFAYPSPYSRPNEFLNCIQGIIAKQSFDAVFPMSDIVMHVIAPHKVEFERYTRLPIPEYKVFGSISDKYNLMRVAMELKVPIPDTIFVPDGNIEHVLGSVPTFPVVVKPGCSIIRHESGWRKTAVLYAQNERQLREVFERHEYLKRPSLIQSRIVGEGQGVFVLMNEGTLIAAFAHRRLREKPPSGGVSVLRESIPLDKAVVDPAIRLLQHVRWHGVAMVEYKVEHGTKTPMLMEINGRFWGSLQLAMDSGLNFPWLLFLMATGHVARCTDSSYRVGVKSRWLLGDLDHLLLRLFKPASVLNLPPGSASRWQCVRDFARFFDRDTYYEMERPGDMRPFFHELLQYVKLR